MTTKLLILALGLILTENIVLTRFLGLPFLLQGPRRLAVNATLGLCVVVSTALSCALAQAVCTYLLSPLGLSYLRAPVCILSAAAFLHLIQLCLRRFFPTPYRAVRKHLPLTAVNCAVLGAALLSTGEGYSLPLALFYGFCTGAGYFLVLLLTTCLQERLVFAECPRSFEGAPITLLTLGLLALVFTGFTGLNIW